MTTGLKSEPTVRHSRLKAAALGLLCRQPVGQLASTATFHLGAHELSRKISQISRYVPPIVDVALPANRAHRPGFRMHSIGGSDQIARYAWWFGWDRYEWPLPALVLTLARDARTVLDVGAYTGFYAMAAACASPDSTIVAFEPFPPVREGLKRNLALNGLTDRVRVIDRAVSDEPGQADFYVPTTKTGLLETAASLNPAFRSEHLQILSVPVVRLDDAVAEFGIGPVDLMKVDVESCEHRVLRGAARLLAEDRPTIFLEVLRGADIDALESIRRAFSYRSGTLGHDGIRWHDRLTVDTKRHDQVFCHESRIAAFERAAEAVGCPCA